MTRLRSMNRLRVGCSPGGSSLTTSPSLGDPVQKRRVPSRVGAVHAVGQHRHRRARRRPARPGGRRRRCRTPRRTPPSSRWPPGPPRGPPPRARRSAVDARVPTTATAPVTTRRRSRGPRTQRPRAAPPAHDAARATVVARHDEPRTDGRCGPLEVARGGRQLGAGGAASAAIRRGVGRTQPSQVAPGPCLAPGRAGCCRPGRRRAGAARGQRRSVVRRGHAAPRTVPVRSVSAARTSALVGSSCGRQVGDRPRHAQDPVDARAAAAHRPGGRSARHSRASGRCSRR